MSSDITKQIVKKACLVCGQEFENAPDKCPLDGTLLTPISADLAPGTVLGGRYEIISIVAGGGMGTVYKARHQMMHRDVAIKTILPSLVSSAATIKRFSREAQAVSLLNHPNILTVFDFFVPEGGQPYLVMDYLQGTNLQEVLKSDQILAVERAVPIFIAACSGLSHAHEHGVIHRDIKPANIMLVHYGGTNDFVKIVDFGIAKLDGSSETNQLTATGDVFGSPEYMSPEQCRAKPLDVRSDIYSLGCVMYTALTGLSPFRGQDSMESMYKQINQLPAAFETVAPKFSFPEGLEEIIFKAIKKNPDERFQTMAEMRAALAGIQAKLKGSGRFTRESAPVQAQTNFAPGVDDETEAAQTTPSLPSAAVTDAPGPSLPDASANTQSTPSMPSSAVTSATNPSLESVTVNANTTHAVTNSIENTSVTPAPNLPQVTSDEREAESSDSLTPVNLMAPILTPGLLANKKLLAIIAGVVALFMVALVMISHKTQSPTESGKTDTIKEGTGVSAPPARQYPGQAPTPAPQAGTTYETYFAAGQKAYKLKKWQDAKTYFQSARAMSESFGKMDSRYVNNVYWIAKSDLNIGRYFEAKSGFEYVLTAIKSSGVDASLPTLNAVKADLKVASRASRRRY